MNELLLAYSKEIDFREPMTLEELIESHRNLRKVNRTYHERWNEEVNAAVNARVSVTINNQYVLWSDLEKMTLVEIAERIG